MQHGRDTDQLADALEAFAAHLACIRVHQTSLGRSLCGAAGDDDDDVVLEQLLHQLNVRGVRADFRVVAADHRDSAAQNAGLHNVDQRLRGAGDVDMAVSNAVKLFLDGLNRVADAGLGLELGNVDQLGLAVLEVFNRHLDDRLGVVRRGGLVELDEVRVRHPGDRGGGDELGVEALGERAKCREDALHVDDDRFAGARQHDVLLLQEVAGHRDALTHRNFVAGAADAADVDALRAVFLGEGDHLRILGVHDDHFGQGRIVAVDNDVDHVLFHDADVGGGVNGLRRAEQDVGELGAHHGAAPAVGQARAQRLLDQRLRQGRTAHVRHVHRLRDLAVDRARLDAGLVPELLGVLRCTLQVALHAERLAIFHQAGLGDFVRQIIDVLAFGLDAPLVGDLQELFRILDLVRAAILRLIQRVADLTAMVRVRGCAARGEAQVVTANDAVYVAAADAARRLRRDAAGAHGANAAAGAGFAEAAVRRLIFDALLPGICADLLAGFKQFVRRFFHLFNSD